MEREHKGDYRQLLLEGRKGVAAKLRCEIQSSLLGDRKGILNELLDYLALRELRDLIGHVKDDMNSTPAGHHLAYIRFLPGKEGTDGIEAHLRYLQDAVTPREASEEFTESNKKIPPTPIS